MSTQMAKLFAAAGQAVPEVKWIFQGAALGQQGLIQQEFNPLGKASFILGIRRAFHQKILTCSLNV
jgi:hypothetical protein